MPTTLVATAAPTHTRIADVNTWDGIAVTVALDSDEALLTNGVMLGQVHRTVLQNLQVAGSQFGVRAGLQEAIRTIPLAWMTWDDATSTGSLYLGSRTIGALIARRATRFECGHVDTDGWARRCGTDLSADCQKCATKHENACRSCA